MNDAIKGDRTMDARGSFCPGPLMELIKTIREVPVGTVLELLSEDGNSSRDVSAWSAKVGHEFLGSREDAGLFRIFVKKTR